MLFLIPKKRPDCLFWSFEKMKVDDVYELDVLESWCSKNLNFRCFIATRNIQPGFRPADKCNLIDKSLVDVIKEIDVDIDSAAFDAYVTGPSEMLQPIIICSLISKGIARERIKVDSFGG
jgi:Na+-transporting NADH:ubiquinone oxidoreductase subunit NqrF